MLAHRFRWRDRTLILLHNLNDARSEATLDLDADELTHGLLDLFGNELYEPVSDRRFTLGGYGYRWLRVRRPLP